MGATSTSHDVDGEAIARILRAERDAELAVAEAGRRAAERVSAARERALELGRQADRRITRINAATERATEASAGALLDEARAALAGSERPLSFEVVSLAVEAVVGWLLGAEETP